MAIWDLFIPYVSKWRQKRCDQISYNSQQVTNTRVLLSETRNRIHLFKTRTEATSSESEVSCLKMRAIVLCLFSSVSCLKHTLTEHIPRAVLAGQHVIYSYPGLTPPEHLFDLTLQGRVGGVILFRENIGNETLL